MAARWADAGVDRLERRLRLDRATVATRRPSAASYATAAGHRRSRTSSDLHARSPTAASRVAETRRLPAALADLARVGTVLELVPGLERLALVRERARTRRTRTASAAALVGALGVDRRRPVRPVHPPAGERRPRRRPLARAADGDGRGLRIELDEPRQVSVTHLRAADLAAATHDVDLVPVAETIVHLDAAHRGLGTASCGPDTLPEYRLEPGTYRWGWTLQRDSRRGPDRADQLVARDRASSTSTTTGSATSCASTTTARSATLHLGAALATGRSYAATSAPAASPASRTASASPIAARVPDDRERRLTASRR